MIKKLKFKVSYATVTPHDPEWFMEEMIIEAYNEYRALETFYEIKKGFLVPDESIKIEEL